MRAASSRFLDGCDHVARLVDAYAEEVVEGRERTLLRLHPVVAPVKAAVLPLISKESAGMVEPARKLYEELRRHHLVEYDDAGGIARRGPSSATCRS